MYDFISNNYENGDELFFFGFSRGAFTVRSVAGLVADVGILSAIQMSKFPDMWEMYRSRDTNSVFRNSEWFKTNIEKNLEGDDVQVRVIGVWDTVGALVC
jgi:uncharacterized protein (DUF2235 family)